MPDNPTADQKPQPRVRRLQGRRPDADDFVMLTTMYAPPRLHRRTIVRERLVEQVTRGVRETPLTLVSAPAGSGKTTLVASWMERPGVPWRIAWLTLSEVTGSPEEFWAFVIEALTRAGVALPHATAVPGVPPVFDVLVTQLATDLLEREEPVVLVLDEGERLSDPEVPRQLELLLRLAGTAIRLVLLCRVDPLLPVQRYRLTGTMTQVRAADLAFTVDEARALLTCNDVELSEETLDALHGRTDGWAAGLQFAALNLEHVSPEARDPGAGDWLLGTQDANLAEYLAGEIVNAQPRHLRDFLLRTSVVDPLSADLAEALTGEVGAAMSLVTLVHHNLLMEAAGDLPGCYQAHPLLRELLRAQLAYESPELVPELHLRAARWFADSGMVEQAVTHFAAAGRWEEAAELVIDGLLVGDVLRPTASGIAQRVADLPPGTAGAAAAVVRAAAAVAHAELAACDAALDQVDDAAALDDAPRQHLAVAVTRLAAAAARADHAQVLAWAVRGEAALAALADDGSPDGGEAPDLQAMLLSAKGSAELHGGMLTEAAATFADAAQACVLAGSGAEHVADLGRYALVEALRGRVHHAHELVDAAENLAQEQSGGAAAALPAALTRARAWLYLEAGDTGAARAVLSAPHLRPDPVERVVMGALHAVLWARVERAVGREAHALEWLDRVSVVPGWLQDLVAQERVALHLHAGRPADARAAAAGVPDRGSIRALVVAARADLAAGDLRTASSLDPAALERRDDVPVDLQVDAWLLEAQARLAAGSREQALTAVRRGIRLARPEALQRPFREAAGEVRRVWGNDAALAEARWLLDAPQQRRAPALQAPPPARKGPEVAGEGPIIVDALSVRETEVLRHLADLLTTEEVAAAMFVSVNTVKSHIRSILRKLSVSRRNEAIRRARELNVI